MLLHSAALAVCPTATCPVAVVRGRSERATADRPVVLGVEAVASDAEAVTVAFTDADRHGTRLTVVHALHGDGPGRDLDERVERELASELAPWRSVHPGVPVDLQVVRGGATGHLLAAAVSARLLVLGTRAAVQPPVTRSWTLRPRDRSELW